MDLGTVFTVMRPYDEALADNAFAELGEYAATLDASKLKIADGKRPISFRCRSLASSQREVVRDHESIARQRRLAFRYGLVEIRDIPREDGGAFGAINLDDSRRSPKDPLTPQAMDRLEQMGIGDADIDFIGAAIMARSFLAHGVPPRVLVPASCLRALDAMLSLRAAPLPEHSTQKDE